VWRCASRSRTFAVEAALTSEFEREVSIIDPHRAAVLAGLIVTLIQMKAIAAVVAHCGRLFCRDFAAN